MLSLVSPIVCRRRVQVLLHHGLDAPLGQHRPQDVAQESRSSGTEQTRVVRRLALQHHAVEA
jgi:hypothetical protein